MTIDEIRARIIELRALRRKDIQSGAATYVQAEQKLREELLDCGLRLSWVRSEMDYGVFFMGG